MNSETAVLPIPWNVRIGMHAGECAAVLALTTARKFRRIRVQSHVVFAEALHAYACVVQVRSLQIRDTDKLSVASFPNKQAHFVVNTRHGATSK